MLKRKRGLRIESGSSSSFLFLQLVNICAVYRNYFHEERRVYFDYSRENILYKNIASFKGEKNLMDDQKNLIGRVHCFAAK